MITRSGKSTEQAVLARVPSEDTRVASKSQTKVELAHGRAAKNLDVTREQELNFLSDSKGSTILRSGKVIVGLAGGPQKTESFYSRIQSSASSAFSAIKDSFTSNLSSIYNYIKPR